MSRKSEFANTWWAQRWIRVLERFGWSARLNRGRSYARHGNVLDLDIQPGLVRAKVQGSRKAPYRVEIGLKPLSRQDWNKVFSLLRRKAIYAARLLSGEMPRDIEEIFKAAEVPLFPQSGEDLIMSCTCPDWASPCKHVAAAYYVLGSEFDRDPFLLFELRGRSKEQVMAAMRGQRPERAPTARAPRVSSEPLEEHVGDFWEANEELDEVNIRVSPPPVPQAILKRLGPVPLTDLPEEWHGDLARMYEVISKDALAFVHVSGTATRVPTLGRHIENGKGDEPEPESVVPEAQYEELEADDSSDGDDAPFVARDDSPTAVLPGELEAMDPVRGEDAGGSHALNGEALEAAPEPQQRNGRGPRTRRAPSNRRPRRASTPNTEVTDRETPPDAATREPTPSAAEAATEIISAEASPQTVEASNGQGDAMPHPLELPPSASPSENGSSLSSVDTVTVTGEEPAPRPRRSSRRPAGASPRTRKPKAEDPPASE